jgi:hypothetical protein
MTSSISEAAASCCSFPASTQLLPDDLQPHVFQMRQPPAPLIQPPNHPYLRINKDLIIFGGCSLLLLLSSLLTILTWGSTRTSSFSEAAASCSSYPTSWPSLPEDHQWPHQFLRLQPPAPLIQPPDHPYLRIKNDLINFWCCILLLLMSSLLTILTWGSTMTSSISEAAASCCSSCPASASSIGASVTVWLSSD